MKKLRVLACGGRHFDNLAAVRAVLDEIHSSSPDGRIEVLIHGGASGADELARIWATEAGVPIETYRASWMAHGRAAGPIRNRTMLEKGRPDLVVAFPGGSGTANMIKLAKTAGVRVDQPLAGVGAR